RGEHAPEVGAVADRRVPHTFNVRPGVAVVTTSSVPARSGSGTSLTYGSGTATMLFVEAGVTGSSGLAVDVYNSLEASIASGKHAICLLVDVCLVIISADCDA